MGLVKRLPRKVLAVLSNLPLAIGEMFAVAALMALGIMLLCFFCLICELGFVVLILELRKCA